MAKKEVLNPTAKNYVFEVLKAVIVALIFSLVFILILALLIPALNIETTRLPILTQVIKGISILAAALLCLRLQGSFWLRGLIMGLVFVALAFIVFSLLDNVTFRWGLNILNDVAVGTVTGLISGVIASLIRKKK